MPIFCTRSTSLLLIAGILIASIAATAEESTEPAAAPAVLAETPTTPPPNEAGLRPEVTTDVALVSAYVWRGLTANEEPVLQPSLDVVIGPITINVWANLDLTNQTDSGIRSGQVSELDLLIDYGYAFGADEEFLLSFGIVDYLFPAAGSTTELYLSFSWDSIVSPSITIYRDVDIPTLYIGLDATYPYQPSEAIEIEAGVSLGLGDKDWATSMMGVSESDAAFGLFDASITVTAIYAIDDHTTASLTMGGSFIINSDAADAFDSADLKTSRFIIGMAISRSY